MSPQSILILFFFYSSASSRWSCPIPLGLVSFYCSLIKRPLPHPTDGQLYSGTVADFSSGDPLIYRKPQRTEQYDLSQLNQPDFISSFEHKEFVYFFFRENAMETTNCGITIYSRVARVCKNDKGGPYQFNNLWTSFVKTRLNCSIPGDYPFYFNELKATSQIITTDQRSSIIYAVFQTPENSIPGSAVCAFDFDDIEAAFNGRFKGQKDSNSFWVPVDHVRIAAHNVKYLLIYAAIFLCFFRLQIHIPASASRTAVR